MSTYIFAIGGSGARVLRSLTMLLASGCKGTAANNEIIANIIDYDSTNGDTSRIKKVMETYHYLHNNAYLNGDTDTEQFFCNPLLMLRDKCDAAQRALLYVNAKFDLHLSTATTHQTFANYIGYNGLGVGAGNNETRQLLESLYDTSSEKIPGTTCDNPKAELNMNLHKGFKGCPNLGCIVTKHLESSSELNLAVNSLIQATDNIVIIGSLFGGTGASGIPMLLDLFDRNENTRTANKAVVALLPYFHVAPPDDNNKSAVNSNTFIAKTKAAISAYNKGLYDLAKCFYFVGDNPQNVFANVDGDAGQKNDAHYVELASAMCILDFIENTGEGGFEVGLKNREDSKVDYNSFYQDETIIPYIHPMARFKLFSTFCKNYLLAGKSDKNDIWLNGLAQRGCQAIGDTGCQNYRKKIKEFIDDFDKWVNELSNPESHRPLILFGNTNDYKDVWNYKKLFIPGGFLRHSWELKDTDFTKPLTDQYNNDNPQNGGIPNRPEYLFWRGSKYAMNEIDNNLRNKNLL